jgi:hypothetical protein
MMQSNAEQYKPHRSFPLRLSASLRQMAYEVAKAEGISLNHFISIAVAERLSRLERDFLKGNRPSPQPHAQVSMMIPLQSIRKPPRI